MAELKLFPLGMQSFLQIRKGGYYYVDKTNIIYKMTHTYKYYFLSRPRRFGKSLLVSTLWRYFEGKKELFKGLAMERLEKEWKQYPVLHISFAMNKYDSLNSLQTVLNFILSDWEKEYGIENTNGMEWGARFTKVIQAAKEKTGLEPVILVDEYDAPLLDTMDDADLQQKLKQEMRKFFSPLKDQGEILRFVFLTGISKFSQLSIFSELNNLNVITMDDDYAAICGITEEEVFTQMKPEIQALADKQHLTYEEACAALKAEYDGYHFSAASPDIYNPYSLINSLAKLKIENFWFSTGTPTLLTKLIKKYNIDPIDFEKGFASTPEQFDAPTETATDPIPLLYQSGYLTIKKTKPGDRFILGYPNEEVRDGFAKCLMPYYATESVGENNTFLLRFTDSLDSGDVEQALTLMRAFLSSVPYTAERQDENHYKTLFYLIARLCTPFVVRTEEASAAGRCDMLIETQDAVYVFEFKRDGTAEDALAQIDSKGYLIPYTASIDKNGKAKRLCKIGANFDSKTRTLGEWRIV